MAKRQTSVPRFDAETIRACGELVRCVEEPRSPRANALVSRIAPSVDRRNVARIVRTAFDQLSSRQREIVVRCDVKGEPYAAVANLLHVSERHVFRERRTALSRIAHQLLTAPPAATKPAVSLGPDAFDVRLALGEALDNGGNWQAAAEVLERLAGDIALPEQRGAVEVRLARLYRDADRYARAYHHAGVARTLAARATIDGDLQRVEADLAVAGIAIGAGNWNLANRLAEQSIVRLRPRADGSLGTRLPNALARALLLKAELLADNGGVNVAFDLASEARDMAGRGAASSSLEIAARAMAATMSILAARDLERSEAILFECYRDAVACGLIRGSLIIATHLALHYRLAGRAADTSQLLAPLVGTARVAGTGWVKSGVLGDLVYANLATGSLGAAAAYAAELAEYADQNPLTQALVELVRARIHLARRELVPALEAARAAERVYATIGLGRYVGLTLDLQAAALSGLGEPGLAQATIAQAIDVLKETGHPRPLANAYYRHGANQRTVPVRKRSAESASRGRRSRSTPAPC